jgi:acetylornithine deacetylase
MRPVIAHKGIYVARCQVQGHAAHSSLTPQGCNAIDYAVQLISWLQGLADRLQEGPQDAHFDVPFTTLSTNLIKGGIAANIIPEHCEFSFEFRNLPKVDPGSIRDQIQQHLSRELLPKMRKRYPKAVIDLTPVADVPAFEALESASITQLIRQLTQETATHKVAYATEAGLFQGAGIPTIVCGPGNIEQAHRADEFVSFDQFARCEDFLLLLVRKRLVA